jgi:DNA-binding transcriptional MerR regulator
MEDDDGGTLLTIGQLARRLEIPVRTIRYWSDIGAVPPAGRSDGGHRLYDAQAVAAWVELAELVQDPGFRRRMRTMAEYHAGTHAEQGFSQQVTLLVAPARERGVDPGSPEAGQVLDRLLAGAGPARRAYVRERAAARAASQSDRYHDLLAVLNGQRARPSRVADLEWLRAALDAHPA